jgi:glutathione S-transferase
VQYLLDKHCDNEAAKSLLPPNHAEDVRVRGKTLQLIHYASGELFRMVSDVYMLTSAPLKTDESRERLDLQKKKFQTRMATFLEKELRGNSFMMGAEYCLVDLMMSYDLTLLRYFGIFNESEFPTLSNYWQRLASRPSFKLTYPF